MWIFTGMMSMILTIYTFVLSYQRQCKKNIFAMIAMTMCLLTVMFEYHLVYRWVMLQDWNAMMDVVPAMSYILWVYAALIIVLNIFAVALWNKR